MQKKKKIRHYSVAPLFHKAALEFVTRKWKGEPMSVPLQWIEKIERMAACEPWWPRHLANEQFCNSYWQAPNLAAALLNYLRERWASLERQKHGKLKKFLARNLSVQWDDSFKKSRASIEEAKELQKICDAHAPKNPVGPLTQEQYDQELAHLDFCQKVWAGRKFPGPVPSTLNDVCVWELEDLDLANAFEKSPDGYWVSKQMIHDVRRQIIAEHRATEKFAKAILDKDGFLQAGGKPLRRKKRIVRARK